MADGVDEVEEVRGVFDAVRGEIAELSSRLLEGPSPEVSLELAFDVQPEIVFPVVATLQGDELCLSARGSFRCEWFPCSDAAVVDRFRRLLVGVLSGSVRLVESVRGGEVIRARLEELSSGRWRTVASWSRLRWPSVGKAGIRVFRNRTSIPRGADLR
jgi:hypothetical protein